jgi:uncharacterized protein (DUF362 family)
LLLYGNPDGTFRAPEASHRKRYLTIVDGVIAGEGNGPEAPDPLAAGLILAGTNPLSVDCVAARIMGFDYSRIPSVVNGFQTRHFRSSTAHAARCREERAWLLSTDLWAASARALPSFHPTLDGEGIELV